MYYVMSDIHGEYEKYMAMLEQIGFCDEDTLFVLGDVIDRGPRPVDVLRDMSMRPNVYPLLGNHELMAIHLLKALLVEVTEENYATQITPDLLKALSEWQFNGGSVTLEQLRALPHEERMALVDYMEEFEPYLTVDTDDGRTFILVHAGLGHYAPEKKLSEYTHEELILARPEGDEIYYDPEVTVIVGHTPTQLFHGKAAIFQSGNMMFIDCGAAFGGKLACLCLDTMREYYV